MDHSGYSGHWDNKPSSSYNNHYEEEDYNHYQPNRNNRRE